MNRFNFAVRKFISALVVPRSGFSDFGLSGGHRLATVARLSGAEAEGTVGDAQWSANYGNPRKSALYLRLALPRSIRRRPDLPVANPQRRG